MKRTLSTLIFLILCVIVSAEDRIIAYTREGKTFVQSEGEKPFKGDQVTTYKWRDKKGNEYPIILHTYTRGEKTGRTTAYIIRTSAKTGKEYKYYLPNGEQIAKEILNDEHGE